jgi:translation initiation factor 3 subunit B
MATTATASVHISAEEERRYYETLGDYENIADFIEFDEDFELPVNFPTFQPDFKTSVIVENLPQVSPEKVEKLTQVILKIYRQFSDTLDVEDLYMPLNPETNQTYGVCFVRLNKHEDAVKAIAATQGFAISKSNHFKVSMYSELEKYAKYPDEYVEPPLPPLKTRPEIVSWLSDPQCRDQFACHYGTETEICWAAMTGEDPLKIYGGEREKVGGKVWVDADRPVAWSPQGTYLTTFHKAGIKLWGADEFVPQERYVHSDVTSVNFSPCENYLITIGNPKQGDDAIIVWDVQSAQKLRSFAFKNNLEEKCLVQATVVEEKKSGSAGEVKRVERVIYGRVKSYDSNNDRFKIIEGNQEHEVAGPKVIALQEPNAFKWSSDGKYVARVGIDCISVYELPSMTLLGKKSIAAKDVQDFSWSPRGNTLAYWAPSSGGNLPSVVNIVEVPSREVLSSRKLFDVSDGKLLWQNDGDYLCVHMTKLQNKKKTYVMMFFRVRESGIPVEQIELATPILNLAWEPSGDRICVMTGEARVSTHVTFYSLAGSGAAKGGKGKQQQQQVQAELAPLFVIKDIVCTDILWSPAGDIIGLVHYGNDHLVLHLHDVENNIALASRRHDRGNRVVWDPSGRIVVSCMINNLRADRVVRGGAEGGFVMYTFQGNLLCQVKKPALSVFLWRPRPKDVLTPEEKKKVIKNLKKYEKDFEKEDKMRKHQLFLETQAKRREIANSFFGVVNKNRALNAAMKAKRVASRSGYDSDDDRNYTVETQVV